MVHSVRDADFVETVMQSEELIIDFLKTEGLFLVDLPDENGKWHGLIRFKKGLNYYLVFFEKKTCNLRIYKEHQAFIMETVRSSQYIPTAGEHLYLESACHSNINVNLYEGDSLNKIAAWL